MFSSAPQRLKELAFIDMIESGRVILTRDLQLKNALAPISITDGGISTVTSDVHSKNAHYPILMHECGIFTSLIL